MYSGRFRWRFSPKCRFPLIRLIPGLFFCRNAVFCGRSPIHLRKVYFCAAHLPQPCCPTDTCNAFRVRKVSPLKSHLPQMPRTPSAAISAYKYLYPISAAEGPYLFARRVWLSPSAIRVIATFWAFFAPITPFAGGDSHAHCLYPPVSYPPSRHAERERPPEGPAAAPDDHQAATGSVRQVRFCRRSFVRPLARVRAASSNPSKKSSPTF